MKRRMLNLMILLVGSVPIAFAADTDPDTTFKRTNPDLLYTTRDFYIDVPTDCYGGQICLKDFFLVVTFNIGMNTSQEVKQIGFRDAGVEFYSKMPAENTFRKQTFGEYSYSSQLDGWKVNIVFTPDKDGSSVPPAVKQFVFDGTVAQNQISGMLTFYLKSGEIFNISIQ